MDYLREFFRSRGYIEAFTPLLVESPGMEPNLAPLEVDFKNHQGKSFKAGLITSPEYSMKKLLGAGLEKIFTITPVFRGEEELGRRWSVEFTMLEWYQQGQNYEMMMAETEELVSGYLGIAPNWPRISYVKEYERRYGMHPVDAGDPKDVEHRFQTEVMPELLETHEAFFLMEYPPAEASLAALTKDGRAAERVEAYVRGVEISNGFTELVDVAEQRRRFALEAKEREKAGKTVFPIDEALLSQLSSVRSPSYGNALGVDRLIMLKAGVASLDAVHPFPPSERFSS